MSFRTTFRRFLDEVEFEQHEQPLGLLKPGPQALSDLIQDIGRHKGVWKRLDRLDREALTAAVFFVGVQAFNNAEGRFGWEAVEKKVGPIDRGGSFYEDIERGVREILGIQIIRANTNNKRRVIGTMVSQSAAVFPLALATLRVIAGQYAWEKFKTPNEEFIAANLESYHYTGSLRRMLNNDETLSAVATVVAKQVRLRTELANLGAPDLQSLRTRKTEEQWKSLLGIENLAQQNEILSLLFDFRQDSAEFEWLWDSTLKIHVPGNLHPAGLPAEADRIRLDLGARKVIYWRTEGGFTSKEDVFMTVPSGDELVTIAAEYKHEDTVKSEIVFEDEFPAELVAVFGKDGRLDPHARSTEVVLVPRPGWAFEDFPNTVWNHVVTQRQASPKQLTLVAPDGERVEWWLHTPNGYAHFEIQSRPSSLKTHGRLIRRSPLLITNTNPEHVLRFELKNGTTEIFKLPPKESREVRAYEGEFTLKATSNDQSITQSQKLIISDWAPKVTGQTVDFSPFTGAILGKRFRAASSAPFAQTATLDEHGRIYAAVDFGSKFKGRGWTLIENWIHKVEFLNTHESEPSDIPKDISELKRGGFLRISGIPRERVRIRIGNQLVREEDIRSYGSVDVRIVDLWQAIADNTNQPRLEFVWSTGEKQEVRLTNLMEQRLKVRLDGELVGVEGEFPQGTTLRVLDVWQPWVAPIDVPSVGVEGGFTYFEVPKRAAIITPVLNGVRQAGATLVHPDAFPKGLSGLESALTRPPNALGIVDLVREFTKACDDEVFDQLLDNIDVFGGTFLRISEAMRWACGWRYAQALVHSEREDDLGLRARRWKRTLELECSLSPLFLKPAEIVPHLKSSADMMPFADAQAGLVAGVFIQDASLLGLVQRYFEPQGMELNDDLIEALRLPGEAREDQRLYPRLAGLLVLRPETGPDKQERPLPELAEYMNYNIPHLIQNEWCVIHAALDVLRFREETTLTPELAARAANAERWWRKAPRLMERWLNELVRDTERLRRLIQ